MDHTGDFTFVLDVVGKIDGGHAAFTELTFDSVVAFQCGVQTLYRSGPHLSGAQRVQRAGVGFGHGGQDASTPCGRARISDARTRRGP